MSGESKPKQPASGSGAKQTLEQVKEAVTFKSSSSCVVVLSGLDLLMRVLFADGCFVFLFLLGWDV